MTERLPHLHSPNAYHQLRRLKRARRRAARFALVLFLLNLITLAAIFLAFDFQRYLLGG